MYDKIYKTTSIKDEMYFTSIFSTSDFKISIDCRNSLTSALALETKDCIKKQCQSNNTGGYYAPPQAIQI